MRKTRIINFFSIAITAILIGTGFLSVPCTHAQKKTLSSFSGIVVHPEEVKPFEIVATIMEIHPEDSPTRLNVAEIDILITPYRYGSQVKKPRLTNQEYGYIVKFEDLEIGQRVRVCGLEQEDGTVIAQQIQILPKRK